MAFDLPEATEMLGSSVPGAFLYGALIFYMQVQLAALTDPQIADVDTSLKALQNPAGQQLLPNGHTSTQNEFLNAFLNYPRAQVDAYRIYSRALIARFGAGGGGGGSGELIEKAFEQTSHGLLDATPVARNSSGAWVAAQITEDGDLVAAGIVSGTDGPNALKVCSRGFVAFVATQQWDNITGDTGGLIPGAYYWLGETAGTLTRTKPTSGIAQVVLQGITDTIGLVIIGEALEVAEASGSGPYVGEIREFGIKSIPTGWLECNGDTCPEVELKAVLISDGYEWGGADGAPLLPDFRDFGTEGRTQDTKEVGTSRGADTHTLATSELPPHVHGINHGHTGAVNTLSFVSEDDKTHDHPHNGSQVSDPPNPNGEGGTVPVDVQAHTGNSGSTGSGTAHNIVGPRKRVLKAIYGGAEVS